MEIVNVISAQDTVEIEFISTDNEKNKEALNSVNKWENDAPSGENRTNAANKIRDVIERNATILRLSHLNVSSLPDVLPHSLIEIEIYSCDKLSALPDILPSGLTKLEISHCPEVSSLYKSVPECLTKLAILYCPKISNAIISLPESLQHIELYMYSKERLSLPFDKLPQNLRDINLSDSFLIEKSKFKDREIRLNGIEPSASLEFKLGDILYGIAQYKYEVMHQVIKFNDFSDKDIFSQTEITDAVWEHREYFSRDEYRDDATIKKILNDADRGIKFKDFLEKHEKYNILSRSGIKSYRPHRNEEHICLSRTSKAGLEFQIMERQERVFFCVDDLVKSIPEIAQKKPDYGTYITASELRWLYRHKDHPNVKNNVQFCLEGAFISQEEVFSLPGWETYFPKRKSNFVPSYA